METVYDIKYKKPNKKPKKKPKKTQKISKKDDSFEEIKLNSNEAGYDMIPEAKIKLKKDKSSEEERLYRDITKKPFVRLRSSEEDDYNDARFNADPDVIHYRDISPREQPTKPKKKNKSKSKSKSTKKKKSTKKRKYIKKKNSTKKRNSTKKKKSKRKQRNKI